MVSEQAYIHPTVESHAATNNIVAICPRNTKKIRQSKCKYLHKTQSPIRGVEEGEQEECNQAMFSCYSEVRYTHYIHNI